MTSNTDWLNRLSRDGDIAGMDGLISVSGYEKASRSPEEVAIMEKAEAYKAQAVFFEASRNGAAPVAQAFIYIAEPDEVQDSPEFASLHKRLWSWGGVPLIYRKTAGVIQLFRCGHKPDFAVKTSPTPVCKPFETLRLAGNIAADPWWDAERLRNGTLWDDPEVCAKLLSSSQAAQKSLILAIKGLAKDLKKEAILPEPLRRKLLILSLLIAYLEERGVLVPQDFAAVLDGAITFADVLPHGPELVDLFERLEERFNGHVFTLPETDKERLKASNQRLDRFARLVRANQEAGGQLTLWNLYSFRDLPVELISEVYQLFVKDTDSSVYTPPFLVRFMLDEVLTWDRLDRLEKENEVILDPSCGSGVFLVEAYKKIILHWRSRNGWKKPNTSTVKRLVKRVHGVDLEPGAVELAAFSLCLAVCDALKSDELRAAIKPFPELMGKTLHASCFFKAVQEKSVEAKVGIIVGNPPFASKLATPESRQAYAEYNREHGTLPDKQIAYLFLHESMKLLQPGGVCCMLQQYNLLYNQQSVAFRKNFFTTWDVREVLDFISVRGLFQKGDGDTKVVVMVTEASEPKPERHVLHATFRRTGRTEGQQGFDIDCYDMHLMPRALVLANDGIWRCNLLGGGRVLDFVNRLKGYRTLGQYADEQGWDYGEGFIEGQTVKKLPGEHLINQPLLPSEALTESGIDISQITVVSGQEFRSAYKPSRFTPPILLIREQMDLHNEIWTKSYLTYKNQIVGFPAPAKDLSKLRDVSAWFSRHSSLLKFHAAACSVKLFTQKATTLSEIDVNNLPYPERSLSISDNEQIIVDDSVSYYRDLIRLGEDSAAMRETGHTALPAFNEVFCRQVNGIYETLRPLPEQTWPGMICQPFVFGDGQVDWSDTDTLRDKLDGLLREKKSASLTVTRIARIYDDRFIFLLKPDRLRYWLQSIALRDADDTLADLRSQGF